MQTTGSRPPARTARGVALSVLAVSAPASGSVAATALAWRLLGTGAASTDPGAALLALAAAALAAVLVWASAAAAAGVRQGWQDARDVRGVRDVRGASASASASTSAGRGRRSDLVAATVAGLVVAALSAPAAGAATVAAPPTALHATVAGTGGQPHDDREAHMSEHRTADPLTGRVQVLDPTEQQPVEEATALPGSWSALAADGFRAPGGVSPGAASLVTGQVSRTAEAHAEVVVTAGDSLWSIAARHLGPDADDAQVAAAWPAWWHENRSTIGEDPDLLLPGQRLRVPTG